MNYKGAKKYMIDKLEKELSPDLTYHGLHHTLDVLQTTVDLCQLEGVSDYETQLLKTAALFHDCGFTINSIDHEETGCKIARYDLVRFDYMPDEIDRICGMVMATKIPQSPKNKLEEILADADLDYLGRDDFWTIGATLFEELKAYNIIQDIETWNRIQIKFLEGHSFLTSHNIKRRKPQKMQHLEELKKIVATYE